MWCVSSPRNILRVRIFIRKAKPQWVGFVSNFLDLPWLSRILFAIPIHEMNDTNVFAIIFAQGWWSTNGEPLQTMRSLTIAAHHRRNFEIFILEFLENRNHMMFSHLRSRVVRHKPPRNVKQMVPVQQIYLHPRKIATRQWWVGPPRASRVKTSGVCQMFVFLL